MLYIYMYHVVRIYARKQYPTVLGYGQLPHETVVCKILDLSIRSQMLTKCECFCLIREKTQVGFLLHLVH